MQERKSQEVWLPEAVAALWPGWLRAPAAGGVPAANPPLRWAYRAASTDRSGWLGRQEWAALLGHAAFLNSRWPALERVVTIERAPGGIAADGHTLGPAAFKQACEQVIMTEQDPCARASNEAHTLRI